MRNLKFRESFLLFLNMDFGRKFRDSPCCESEFPVALKVSSRDLSTAKSLKKFKFAPEFPFVVKVSFPLF